MISIEIIEGCNFKCYFCAAKDIDKYKFMDIDVFKKAVLEARELGIKTVDMIPSRGDPFLHPHIYEMLDFINEHMEEILIFTNATPVNVAKLSQCNLSHTILSISLYGKTTEKFIELTKTDERMFNKFNKKLRELDEAGIKYNIERRDEDYEFDTHGVAKNDFDASQKCKFHHIPKILVDGSVTFCRTAWSSNGLSIGNLSNKDLHDLLSDPIRYKFMDSQSICEHACDSYEINCNTKTTFAAIKLMSESRARYLSSHVDTEIRYKKLENETIQRTES